MSFRSWWNIPNRLFCAAITSIFLQLYLYPAVHIFFSRSLFHVAALFHVASWTSCGVHCSACFVMLSSFLLNGYIVLYKFGSAATLGGPQSKTTHALMLCLLYRFCDADNTHTGALLQRWEVTCCQLGDYSIQTALCDITQHRYRAPTSHFLLSRSQTRRCARGCRRTVNFFLMHTCRYNDLHSVCYYFRALLFSSLLHDFLDQELIPHHHSCSSSLLLLSVVLVGATLFETA